MTTPRYKKEIRTELVLRAAINLARQPGGWSTLTRQKIAASAACSEGLVSHALGDMKTARKLVMKTAIREHITEIIGQSLVACDGYCTKRWLPEELRRRSLIHLLGL